ncbi:ferredoxin [Acidihalobacter aeolianus]|uniref:Ferredoxin n=1 Tax=Acidihalobacter aeolianus TaxID=2792603 RepID=A0A1D8K9X6_9GAMM|nr:4Fe-4S binding protein [Acidihalobacter aeolianus]AOV17773.1 ferredoxin [Acidihalobacter aeolianus]
MSLRIVSSCVNCWACQPVCPSDAILQAPKHFVINDRKSTECEGSYDVPQCASICPIEGAITNAAGEAMNPPGSLTGIPPEMVAAAQAEIRAR